MVKTNMGYIPIEDYLELVALQYGYDSYEEMKSDGICVNFKNESEE